MFGLIRLAVKLAVILFLLYSGAQFLIDRAFEASIGTKVRIGSIRLHLNPAEIEVRRIKIYNLKGFKEPHLAILPEVFIRINLADLLKGKTHIELMRINLDEIRIEKNADNQINLNELRKNLDKKQAEQTEQRRAEFNSQSAPASSGKKPADPLIIDRAVFSLGKAVYADTAQKPAYHKEFILNIREQALNNVTDPVSVVQQLITAILNRVGVNLASAKLDQWGAQMGAQTGALVENAKKSLEGLFK